MRGLMGNTDREGNSIRLRDGMSDRDAAMTLIYELYHLSAGASRTREQGLEQEIEARIYAEKWAIKMNIPETSPNYRNEDGTVNEGNAVIWG